MPATNTNQQDLGPVFVAVLHGIADVLVLLIQVLYAIVARTIQIVIRPEPKSVRGEIVLITGAGHGIGKELALLYASEGATVVVWDINEKNGNQTVEEIAQRGYPKAHFFVCDVAHRDNVLAVAKTVQNKVGDVTILVNNAGIMPTHPFLEQSKDEIERVMNINVMAHFWTLQAFLPAMKRHNHGHVVALSSIAGHAGAPNVVPYCCSKFAVRGMMEALYQECRTDKRNQIKFTTVCPYMVDTGLCKKPLIRFEKLAPLVKPKVAAAAIMDAQRRDVLEVGVPGYILYLLVLLRVFPVQAQMYLYDFAGVGLESDLS